ncbi:MFS drug transporter [Aspergillus luchuensis]|uniref:MFS drug transporter n=1 Tax=Aspergillus kawachii TaxID=1069201 RepID=A0A146FXC4_ASPKA|nr:MFS drug transporter [Aspergillus luchuensis]
MSLSRCPWLRGRDEPASSVQDDTRKTNAKAYWRAIGTQRQLPRSTPAAGAPPNDGRVL